MNLIEILSNENKRKVVKTLLDYPNRRWTISELEITSKAPHATTWRTVKELERMKILTISPVGKRVKIIELVQGSPLIEHIKQILRIETLPHKEIANKFASEIKKFSQIYSCILFGSVVRGTAKPESDIDILILTKGKPTDKFKENIDRIASRIEEETHFSLYIDMMSLKKFKNMIKTKNPFVDSIKKEGVVLLGKRPFGRG